jgi:hypothetical protein
LNRAGRLPGIPFHEEPMTEIITEDALNRLEAASYLCNGETTGYFEHELVPKLASFPEAELWALSGFFMSRSMLDEASFVADYARVVRTLDDDAQPPDPTEFMRKREEEREAYRRWAKEQPPVPV